MRESDLMKYALSQLLGRYNKGKIWRANSGGNKSGRKHNSINLPDFVGWTGDGFALAFEVKTSIGKLTDDQYYFLRDVAMTSHGISGLINPAGLFYFSDIHLTNNLTKIQKTKHLNLLDSPEYHNGDVIILTNKNRIHK